jgi:hypothetical protein
MNDDPRESESADLAHEDAEEWEAREASMGWIRGDQPERGDSGSSGQAF